MLKRGEQERETLKTKLDVGELARAKWEARAVTYSQAIARLREALHTYGVHLTVCMLYRRTAEDIARYLYPACTCGLAAARIWRP
jgi:hypothetical protein